MAADVAIAESNAGLDSMSLKQYSAMKYVEEVDILLSTKKCFKRKMKMKMPNCMTAGHDNYFAENIESRKFFSISSSSTVESIFR